jgi:hypothetical protein
MKYTLVIIGKEDQELLDRGLPYEKFLLGPKNSSAPLELSTLESQLERHQSIARLELVHIHAARDHLVLTNPSILEITPEESNALFESIKDILAEISSVIYRPNALPGKWFIEANKLSSLSTVHTQCKQKEETLIRGCLPTQILQELPGSGANGKTRYK